MSYRFWIQSKGRTIFRWTIGLFSSVRTRSCVYSFVRSFVRIYFSHDYLLLLSVIRNIVEYIVDISVQLTETWSSDWETASCRRDACRPPDNKHAKRTFSETRGLKKKKEKTICCFLRAISKVVIAYFVSHVAMTRSFICYMTNVNIFNLYDAVFVTYCLSPPFSPCISLHSLFFVP